MEATTIKKGMKWAFASLAIFCLTLIISGAAFGQTGEIYGYVYDWDTGEPIPDATASLYYEDGSVADTQPTDADGFYWFFDVPLYTYLYLGVDETAYVPQFYFEQPDFASADPIYLDEIYYSWEEEFYLETPTVSVTGTVWTTDDPPEASIRTWYELVGAEVQIWSDTLFDGDYQITDDAGEFSFSVPPAGDYILSVYSPGSPSIYYNGKLSEEFADPIDLTGGDVLSLRVDFDPFASQGDGAIKGAVTIDGAAYPDVWVEAWSPSTGARYGAETLGTLVNGQNYAIEGVIPGTYEVTVYTYENITLRQTVEVTGTVDGVNFELSDFQGNSISGTVSNLSADETAVVSAWSPSNDYYGDVLVVGTGSPVSYTIADLPPAADYLVEIYPDSHLYQVYPLGYDWSQAAPVDISGDSIMNINFELVDQGDLASISGAITLTTPLETTENIWVEAESLSTGFWSGVEIEITPQDCATVPCTIPYTIGGLLSGTDYIVSAWPDTFMPLYYDNTSDYEEAAPAATGRDDIDFTLSQGATISGRIIDGASSAGMGGVFVSAWSETTYSWGDAIANADGTYTIAGLSPASDFIVEVDGGDLGFFYYGGAGKTVRDYALAAPVPILTGPATGIDIAIQAGQRITGKVLSASGKPVSGVWVSAWSDQQLAGNENYTGINGEFTISGLPEGSDYNVSVWPDWESDYLPGAKDNVKTCTADCTPVELVLRKNAEAVTVSGRVTGPGGAPAVEGAIVDVWSESLGDMGGYAWAETDSDGAFTIPRIVPANDYELTVWPPLDSQYAVYTETSKRDISASLTNVNIELDQGGVIRGTVLLPDGAPATGAWVFAYSQTALFWNYDTADRKGGYEISQIPKGLNDYLVTVILDGYLEATRALDAFPTANVDFQLATEGVIFGTVTHQGNAVAGAEVEITRVSNNGETLYWAASTGPDGKYSIGGIPITDENGQEIANYQVAARADGYPTKELPADKKANQRVDIALERNTDNILSGKVENIANPALANAYIIVNAINPDNPDDWAWTQTSDDGGFTFTELTASSRYQLRFTAHDKDNDFNVIYDQWNANGAGVNETEAGVIPAGTTTHAPGAGDTILFNFTIAKKRTVPVIRPGVVRNMRTAGDLVQKLVRATSEKIIRSPNVTIQWDPTPNGRNEKYYYTFNTDAGHVITKRNANKPGVTTRKVTSRTLKGDNVKFWAHVAAEDNRGRIGGTEHMEFLLDTEAPKNPTVKIDAKNQARTSGSILLNLGATNATEMYISDVNFGQGGKWENYSATKQWKLPTAGGETTLYIQFRDEAQNVSQTSITVKAAAGVSSPLGNAIIALKVLTGVTTGITDAQYTAAKEGVSDTKVNLRDVISFLQKAAGIR